MNPLHIRKPSSEQSDAQLVQACEAGDQGAWEELVHRYRRLIYSIPRRYGLSETDADDVFQAVFIAVHRSLTSLKDHDRLSSWLITITHRECWRIGRKTGSSPDLDQQIVDVGAPSEEQIQRWEQQDLVRRGLEELGGRCEELLSALFLEPGQANYESIAEQLGMKVGSIGPTRARCFKKLQRILLALGLDPGVEAPPTETEED